MPKEMLELLHKILTTRMTVNEEYEMLCEATLLALKVERILWARIHGFPVDEREIQNLSKKARKLHISDGISWCWFMQECLHDSVRSFRDAMHVAEFILKERFELTRMAEDMVFQDRIRNE